MFADVIVFLIGNVSWSFIPDMPLELHLILAGTTIVVVAIEIIPYIAPILQALANALPF